MKKFVVFLGGLLFIFLNLSGCGLNNNGNIVGEPSIGISKNNKKVALVIGNGAYKIEPLTNSANDAHDMAAVLHKVGFDVTLRMNASKATTEKAIKTFQHELREDGVGIFYYSGHAIRYENENYMIPIGAMEAITTIVQSEKKAISTFKKQVVKMENVVTVMEEAKSKLNLVFLDAYRDNPFKSFEKSIASGWKSGVALTTNAERILIAYAASPKKGVENSSGRNSHYTEKLLQFIEKPLPIEFVLKKVRAAVKKKTDGLQVPWYITSIEENFKFVVLTEDIPTIISYP
jgi:uncharacterized caspase-like protein